MAGEPVGPLSGLLSSLASALSRCPTWQEWCGVVTEAAALEHVVYLGFSAADLVDGSGAPLAGMWPRAVVLMGMDLDLTRRGIGSENTYLAGGVLEVEFWSLISSGYASSYGAAFFEHFNSASAVALELPVYGSVLNLRRIRMRGRPRREAENEPLAYYTSKWAVYWGFAGR